jgi:hypothetical protein
MKKLVAIAALLALAGTAEGKSRAPEKSGSLPPCFSASEIEAEQAMLFQTELMVVSEACKNPSYVKFVQRNRDAVIAFQKRMIDHFRRHGSGKPEITFDSYMTRLANESALRNGQVPVTQVCAQGARLMETGDALGAADFRIYAEEKARLHKPYYRMCDAKSAAAK